MKTLNLKTLLAATAATACTFLVAGQPVQAGGFKTLNSDWNIVLDSFNDGTTGGVVGSLSDYEMFGMAAKVVDGQAYFAINANLGLEGKNGVTYGDLFFNFSDMTFKDASAASKLFAVRFAPNDAGVEKYGVYENVTAKGVAKTNSGHDGFGNYQTRVETELTDNTPGVAEGSHGTVGFGDLTPEEALAYLAEETYTKKVTTKERYVKRVKPNGDIVWGTKNVTEYVPATKISDKNYSIQNVIASGDWMDNIAMLSADELTGLDFGTNDETKFAKAQTFGFKFDAAKLPEGNALITLLQECINDGMAMKAKFAAPPPGIGVDVPEPTSIVSLGLIGLALAGGTLRKKS
jgi:hypothetical protein